MELPEEDREEGLCAKMKKAMCGTRGAAQSWEATYRKAHEDWGFANGKASPCVMHHSERNIMLVVHGDDFTALGKEEQLNWYREVVTDRYRAKVKGRLGPGKTDGKSMRVLIRMVQWTAEGMSMRQPRDMPSSFFKNWC